MKNFSNAYGHTGRKDFPYFRRLWNNIVAALMAASFLPLILVGGGMYYYTSSVLKQKTIDSLCSEVTGYRETLDQFLLERTIDLKFLFQNKDISSLIRPGGLEVVFQSMQSQLPCFKDLGIIDGQGRHLAYAGPFDLISKNYKNASWFQTVMDQDVYISDVFIGFRNEPHFIIAVKTITDKGIRIIRATMDTKYFNNMVTNANSEKKGKPFLINKHGIFQSASGTFGQLMKPSKLKNIDHFTGIRIEKKDAQVRFMTWLENVPWIYVVEINQNEIFEKMHRVRNVGAIVLLLSTILIIMTVLLTTNYLVSLLEFKRQSLQEMHYQLTKADKMALSTDIFSGVLHEMKDIMNNIDITAKWANVPVHSEKPDEVEGSLRQIGSEVGRGLGLIERFQADLNSTESVITEININEMLDDLIVFFKTECDFNSIKIKKDFQEDITPIQSDPYSLRHVFQNLVQNALSAIGKGGELDFTTRMSGDSIIVTITDTGPGISEGNMEKIFEPLFTTKPDGTGLGLAISADILEKLDSEISVRNEPGKGACFTVCLPLYFTYHSR